MREERGVPLWAGYGQNEGLITYCTFELLAKIRFSPDCIDNVNLTCPYGLLANLKFSGPSEHALVVYGLKNL